MIDITLLKPGTEWLRTSSSNRTTKSTVLFVTNTHLAGTNAAAKNPPQVVFLDAKNQVCSMDAERYIKSRTLMSTDIHLQARIDNVFNPEAAPVQEALPESPILAAAEEAVAAQETTWSLNLETNTGTLLNLDDLLAAYNTQPIPGFDGAVMHEIIIATPVDSSVSVQMHADAQHVAAIVSGSLRSDNLQYQGVFPMHTGNEQYSILYFYENMPSTDVVEITQEEVEAAGQVELTEEEVKAFEDPASTVDIVLVEDPLAQAPAMEVTPAPESAEPVAQEEQQTSTANELEQLIAPEATAQQQPVVTVDPVVVTTEQVATQEQQAAPAQGSMAEAYQRALQKTTDQ